jgi:hypothetical protein
VLVSKYGDHLPLYRQAQIYKRQGIDLDLSTLADWVGRAAWHLRPVHQRLLDHSKSSSKLFAEDDCPGARPGTWQNLNRPAWAYARDDRPWQGMTYPVSLAFRCSNVRRRFYELPAAGPALVTSETLKRIAEL